MAEAKNNKEKDADIGWNRFADFVDSLLYCLSKYDGTKELRNEIIKNIEMNPKDVSLESLLSYCKDVASLENAFEQLYGLLYEHQKYENMFTKLSLESNIDDSLSKTLSKALFTLSRIIRNHEFMRDSILIENEVNYLRKAFMYRSMCYFLAKKLQDSYKDYLFSVVDWENEHFDDTFFDLSEEFCDDLKIFHSEVIKQINVQEPLSAENIRKFIPRLKELFQEISSKSSKENEASTSKQVSDLFVSENVLIENSWKNKGRAFVAKENIQPRTRLFEEFPFSHVIYDVQLRCEHCGKQLIKCENYDSSQEEGNGLQISSFFPSFSRDCLIYCDLACANNNRKSIKNYPLRPLLAELGVASLPLKKILHGQNMKEFLIDWKTFQNNPNTLEESNKNQALIFKLMNHITEHDKENLASYTLVTAFVTYSFRNNFKMIQSEEIEQFATCFLHQLLTLSTNVITIQDQTEDNPVMIGVGLYPTIAILNHSCKPNLVPIFSGIRLILETVNPISRGNEALFCYDTDLKAMDLDERKDYFRKNYFFDCDCVACNNNQRDFSEALICNFKPKEGPVCRKAAFVKGNKIVCRNVPKHEIPLSSDVPDRIEKIAEKYKFGNRMSQIFDQSEQADDATQAFLALNDAAKLAQEYLHPLHELSLSINRGMIKIYASMGHYSRAITHSDFLIKTFRNHSKISWIDLQHEIVREFDRFIQLSLLDFEDNKPTRSSINNLSGCINKLQEDYEILKYQIGDECFESYYSGRIEKLEEYRKKMNEFLD